MIEKQEATYQYLEEANGNGMFFYTDCCHNRIKRQLLNDNKNAKMNNSQIKKINEIFFSMINFF